VVERAQGQGVVNLIRSLLAVPADVGRLDGHRIAAKRAVEAADSTSVGIGAQDFLGEPRSSRSPAPSRWLQRSGLQRCQVKVDGFADERCQRWGEVQVEQLAGRRSQGGRISQQLLDLRPQAPDRASAEEPAPPFRDVEAQLAAALIAEVPQLPLQVDKGHGGALARTAWASNWWAEVVDQATDRLLGILVRHQGGSA
jgi:hypothetical protein